jgi:DNA-binding NarL/FixJ family response regulator
MREIMPSGLSYSRFGRPHTPAVLRLTPREAEVVQLAAAGLRNKQIAARLGIGEGTVRNHLHDVYEKLGVATRTEMGLLARAKRLA